MYLEQIVTNPHPYDFPEQYPPAQVDQEEAILELRQNLEDQFGDDVVSAYDYNLSTMAWSQNGILEVVSSKLYPTIIKDKRLSLELPLEAVAMIGGIYALTNADIVKVDVKRGGVLTEILRKGTYRGQDIYFSEIVWDQLHNNSFQWLLTGENRALAMLHEPTEEQADEQTNTNVETHQKTSEQAKGRSLIGSILKRLID